ncbi:sensor histidine kinase [Paenibacillus agaridevorans]|uniref:Sensor histidine kinase n=1 Tax=Paenibacillus agaridevorans TaxID=171404 RepID=A0A2R5ETN6_9BACL|nr:sensor histidine kinase [Paenibacillus agaridevorans]GBG10046.1 sensor histidine kinase [Paenibacillus agaridevorans]
MRKRFFVKNMLLFLIPLLIPTIVLGTLSIVITKQNREGETARDNLQLMHQIDRNMELVFQDIETLGISMGTPEVLYQLEEILRTQYVTFDNQRLLGMMRNLIDSPANAKPFIQSIYVHVNNPYNQFLASGTGLSTLDRYPDSDWLERFRARENPVGILLEQRQIQRYSFEDPIAVTTLYKPLTSLLTGGAIGVIAVNIYTDYLDRWLQSFASMDGQHLIILDEAGGILFRNQTSILPDSVQEKLSSLSPDTRSFDVELDKQTFAGTQLMSGMHDGWRYISLVPKDELNRISFRLSQSTIYVVALSFLLGLALTYLLTRRSLRHIHRMISIIKSAEKGLPLPEISSAGKGEDEYGYIIQTMTRNFIQSNYLGVQLSEKKFRLQAAELLALQSQINPHFLFNTLETLNWKAMALTGRPNEVNDMLEHLSELLRYTLDKPGRIVPLMKEIDYTKHYVAIQQIRYGDKFRCVWAYDPDDIQPYSTVKLVLQPLIENSLYHGIKEMAGNGGIKIKLVRYSGWTAISVIDNGVGMSKERLKEVRRSVAMHLEDDYGNTGDAGDTGDADHIGLANTNRRIRLAYGTDEGLQILSKQGLGTVVRLKIPD